MKFYDYELVDIKGHIEVFRGNEFQFSADSISEAQKEITENKK